MALLLDLSQVRGTGEHLRRSLPASAFVASDDELRVVGECTLEFDVGREAGRVRLVGDLRTTLELPCSRCLEPMHWAVDAPFDVRYVPMADNAGDDDQEVEADDLGVGFYEGDAIDLGQLAREQLYLSLPMKALCRPDCLGLCPECGANRNITSCGCEHRWIDPRLAGLRALLPKEPRDH